MRLESDGIESSAFSVTATLGDNAANLTTFSQLCKQIVDTSIRSKMEGLTDLFQKIGLSETKAKETAANKKLGANLEAVIREADAVAGVDRTTGALFYTLASTITPKALPYLPYISKAIKNGKLTSNDQISAAIKFAEKAGPTIDDKKFDQECGVGVVVTPEEVRDAVSALIASKRKELEEKRYQMLGQLLGALRTSLRWASSLAVKEELDKQILAAIGPKDERDNPKTKVSETGVTFRLRLIAVTSLCQRQFRKSRKRKRNQQRLLLERRPPHLSHQGAIGLLKPLKAPALFLRVN